MGIVHGEGDPRPPIIAAMAAVCTPVTVWWVNPYVAPMNP